MRKPAEFTKRWLLMSAALLLVAVLWPVATQTAPDWLVCVVDESNTPVAGVLIRESYQNYSAEQQGHEEDQYSNERGCVHFAQKQVRSSLGKRLVAVITSGLAGAHASFGPNDYVTAFSGGLRGDDVRDGLDFAWKGSPDHEESKLVLRSGAR